MEFTNYIGENTYDSAKLFIGQIPKDMEEGTLSSYFQEFGSIKELSIIRDSNNSSKGCAFITFYDENAAKTAVESLHGKIKLPNSLNPLQVKFAETQIEKENKLFVGMLPKTFSEKELQSIFRPFGELREIHIIRGVEGAPKGCAFVKFADKEAALNAIENLNETVPSGGTRPLVVKFADQKKARIKPELSLDLPDRSYAQQKSDFWFSQIQPTMREAIMIDNSVLRNSRLVFPFNPNTNISHSMDYSQVNFHNFAGNSFNSAPLHAMPLSSPLRPSHDIFSHESSNLRPPEGPEGANLFIYHLPRDITDADLATLFAPFGNVISAKVFVDKKTSDSKGFGFVSYDCFESANSAIDSMNGFQIGSKRLKVQHKRTSTSSFDHTYSFLGQNSLNKNNLHQYHGGELNPSERY